MKTFKRMAALLMSLCMAATLFAALGMTATADHAGTELPDISVSLDYGVPMTINPFEGSELTGTITAIRATEDGTDATELTLSYGTARLNADGKTVTFTPTSMVMSAPEHIYYVVGDQTGKITIVPATNIYFDDSFSSIQYALGDYWSTVGTTYTGEQRADIVGDDAANLYGYDAFNEAYNKFSFGSAHYSRLRAGLHNDGMNRTITFTFRGTGFDLYAMTGNYAGSMSVKIFNGEGRPIKNNQVVMYFGWVETEEGIERTALVYSPRYRLEGKTYVADPAGNYAQSRVDFRYVLVDQFYDENGNEDDNGNYFKETAIMTQDIDPSQPSELYHNPVYHIADLPLDTYTIDVYPWYTFWYDPGFAGYADFHFDGVRIYGACEGNEEAEAAYLKDTEANPYYERLRKLLLEQANGDGTGILSQAGGLFVDGNNNASIDVYKVVGPNNEVYLAKNQAIALNLHFDKVPEGIHFSAKTLDGAAKTGVTVQSTSGQAFEIKGSASMYHDITSLVDFKEDPNGGYVTRNPIVFMNTEDEVVSLVMIKCTGGAPKADITDQETAKDIVKDLVDGGDGTPDKYQKPVTFVVVNGTWGDGTTENIDLLLPLTDENGDWSETGSAQLTAPEGMLPLEGYGNGTWDVVPPATVSGTDHETFTFTFTPTKAPYKVEHYKQQTDGTYALEETEDDLVGAIGEKAEATPKDYENYEVNEEKSELSGTVYLPESDEEAPLTLKVYYDLQKHTVTYDLNGATATGYDPADYFHGTEATVKAAPAYEGYTFLGWSDGETTLQPEAVLTVNADIHLVAQWEKKEAPTEPTQPTTPADPNKPSTGDFDNPVLWIALLGVSLIGVAVVVILVLTKSRKNKK